MLFMQFANIHEKFDFHVEKQFFFIFSTKIRWKKYDV